jgi:hypothetical protein
MGLIDNGTGTSTTIPCDYCFKDLFGNDSTYITDTDGVTSVSKNFLPASNTTVSCYESMFALKCTSMTSAPDLPATVMSNRCYCSMFAGCALTEAPYLPATTLAQECYKKMFVDCTSLNSIKLGYTGTAASAPTNV